MMFRSMRGQALSEYWHGLKSTLPDSVPTRSMLDPSAIKPLLPYLLLHDLATPGKSMLRLVGTAITERLGLDPTGRDYLELVNVSRRPSAYRLLITLAIHPCGVRLINEIRYMSGKRTTSEAVGFPLRHDRDGTPMLLFIDDPIEAPEFDLDPREQAVDVYRISDLELIDVGFGIPNLDD